MWKVWIHSSQRLDCLQLDEKGQFEDLSFEIKGEKLIVCSGEQSCQIEKNSAKSFQDRIIRWVDSSSQSWYAYAIGEFLKAGRAPECDLRFRSHTVSNYQFTITKEKELVLRDQGSTNGTYVNGKRVQSCSLKSGDRICFADKEAYIVKDYLILDEKLRGYCRIESEPLPSVDIQLPQWNEAHLPMPDIQSYEMELPYLHPPLKKGNLFQALSSSMLILVSGLASTLAVKLISPDHTERAFMMLMTSGSMCIAFLMYGLLNREIQWKDKLKDQKAGDENYRLYIESCERELDQMKNAYLSKISQIQDWYGLLEDDSFGAMSNQSLSLCVGQLPQLWISIKTGKSGYQYQKNELYRYLQTVIHNWSSPVLSPAFLQPGQSGQISVGQIPYVFVQWCWLFWNPGRKWVWITENEVYDAFIAFEGCLEDHVRLIVRKVEDVFRIQRVIDNQKHYVVYYTDESWMKKLHFPADTLFLKGVSHSGYGTPEAKYDSIKKFSLFQQYCRIRSRETITFRNLFGPDPKPSDTVNLEIILGIDEKNQRIRLDLSEYGDGPHGFIAGMTGSGKSELISSLLMQLVLNNDPAHLQYLIIDFKGGAFGQAFYHFSHCAGMLTNLDSDELFRFRKGIHFEVQRRQALLKEFTTQYKGASAHIDAYNEVHPSSPISHLLIIVDELAQLKAEAPEFMANLKEVARVGRSLGIHCLLSTQKPLGIIDDQILANSKFKICLSVSSKADSREVLQHDGAYSLTDPGQFILQIQNKETESIGRSFWLQENMDTNSNFWMEVDENEAILAQNTGPIPQTVNQYYSQKVLDMYPHHSYIIPLFDQSAFETHKDLLALVDIPEKNLQSEWDISFGQSVAILCKNREQILQLIPVLRGCHHSHPVYTISIPQITCDFSQITELSFIDDITDFCTLILFVHTLSDLSPYLSLVFHKKVRLFCFISQYQSRDKSILHSFSERLCFGIDAIDELRSFFELFLPVSTKASKGKGLVKMQDMAVQILFRQPPTDADPPLRNVFRYKRQQNGFLAGVWNGEKVYWQGKRRLLICYAQKSRREIINRMIEGWKAYRDFIVTDQLKEPFEICVINMIHDFDQLNGPAYKEMMYDMDVMWIGAGLEDYSFYLKKKTSVQYAGKNMLWQQGEPIPFDIVEAI